jgi:SPP1 gp7 family putative phage head morphogenesis protein
MKGLKRLIGDVWVMLIKGNKLHQDALNDPLRVQVLEHVERSAPSLIGEIGKKVSGHNAREMRRIVGIDPRIDPGTGPVLDQFREENLRLITNLTEDMQNRVGAIVKDYLGGRVEDLTEELQDGLGFARARANLIARDQTLKLNGQLTRVRQQNSGISEYVWTTSNDERVREEHAAKDGQRFRWDNPPPDTGHPGEDFQCRCTAYPIIPGLDESDDSESEE